MLIFTRERHIENKGSFVFMSLIPRESELPFAEDDFEDISLACGYKAYQLDSPVRLDQKLLKRPQTTKE